MTPWASAAALIAAGGMVGLGLLIAGLWPRRSGSDPFCRRCGYNLTGRTSDCCTECGADVSAVRAIRYGTRHRCWGLVFSGLALLLLATAPVATVAIITIRGFDWVPHAPAWLVAWELDNPSESRANRALQDMQRRQIAGTLTHDELLNLADWCLVEQARPTLRTLARTAIQILGDLIRDGTLEGDRLTQFARRCVAVDVRIRTPALRNMPCPVEVQTEQRFPAGMTANVDVTPADPDIATSAEPWPTRVYDYSGMGFFSQPDRRHFLLSDSLAPGVHALRLGITIQLLDSTGSPNRFALPTSPPIATSGWEMTVPLELLTSEPPDYIRLVKSADADRMVRDYFRSVRPVLADDRAPNAGLMFGVQLGTWDPIPMNLALRISIFAQNSKVAIWTTDFDARAGERPPWSSTRSSGDWDHLPDKFSIVVRSAPDVAKDTVDLWEIWDGEIRFDDLELITQD